MEPLARRSAFHDFMRAVFAEHSVRARLLRRNRARWLRRLSQSDRLALQATNKVFLHPG